MSKSSVVQKKLQQQINDFQMDQTVLFNLWAQEESGKADMFGQIKQSSEIFACVANPIYFGCLDKLFEKMDVSISQATTLHENIELTLIKKLFWYYIENLITTPQRKKINQSHEESWLAYKNFYSIYRKCVPPNK